MARFFPPESEVERAGAVHVLTSSEADYMQMTGTLVWDEARQGLVLAPGRQGTSALPGSMRSACAKRPAGQIRAQVLR